MLYQQTKTYLCPRSIAWIVRPASDRGTGVQILVGPLQNQFKTKSSSSGMENRTLDDIYDVNTISFLVLGGGNSKRLGREPKLQSFIRGENLLLRVIERINCEGPKFYTVAILHEPSGKDIDILLKKFNFYEKYNLGRVIYSNNDADSKAYALWEVTTNKINTPLVAVLQGSVVYSKVLFSDFFKKLREFNQKKSDNCGGMIYLANNNMCTPTPTFKTKYENETCQICLEEICMEKTKSERQPVISVFDTKKLKALDNIPRNESEKERAGTTYLYDRFMKKGYRFCIIKSPYTIAHLNTPESIDDVRRQLDNNY